MGPNVLVKVTAQTAAELLEEFELEDESKPLLQPNHTPQQFLDALTEAGQFRDAVQLLAHALPPREATWWSCLCARSVTTAESAPIALSALQAAEAWAFQPTEEHRRAAESVALAKGALDHPAGWAAQAAFWSAGSLSPAENPEVPPGRYLAAKAVAAALLIGAVSEPLDEAPQRFRNFLAWGLDIARGGSGTAS
jgi:hypothetical protein